MADVLGQEAVPEQAEGFQPHASLAYVNRDQPASAVVAAIDSGEPEPAHTTIADVSLIEMHRDDRMYQWRTIATASLGACTVLARAPAAQDQGRADGADRGRLADTRRPRIPVATSLRSSLRESRAAYRRHTWSSKLDP
jgi:hypothetical protein